MLCLCTHFPCHHSLHINSRENANICISLPPSLSYCIIVFLALHSRFSDAAAVVFVTDEVKVKICSWPPFYGSQKHKNRQ